MILRPEVSCWDLMDAASPFAENQILAVVQAPMSELDLIQAGASYARQPALKI